MHIPLKINLYPNHLSTGGFDSCGEFVFMRSSHPLRVSHFTRMLPSRCDQ